MPLLHDLISGCAESRPSATALIRGDQSLTYEALQERVARLAAGLARSGVKKGDRVAIYLPKHFEAVIATFAASHAGCMFVPVNPVLKAAQVGYILRDSAARVLVTSADRLQGLEAELADCPDLDVIAVTGLAGDAQPAGDSRCMAWDSLFDEPGDRRVSIIDADPVAILYTSGSTGKPKGVLLSQRNMVAGAESVSTYLGNTSGDRLLAVLPFSFDYGFSQLTTAFRVGASVVLMDYLLPRDVLRAAERYAVSGLAAVPPLWIQLAGLEWPEAVRDGLRYITNSGGAMPATTLARLREQLPATSVFLMYGLTEAFRSTYLPPDQVDARPGSIGKAIPNAEVLVVRPDGCECDPGEPGELVHRGALVGLGYWKDPERTAERFRPWRLAGGDAPLPEIAVWSGDTVTRDEEGYLYFVGRRDEMIKTSGYRVSPTEVEEIVFASGLVTEAVAFGVEHPTLGKAIVVAAVAKDSGTDPTDALLAYCRSEMPNYMVPQRIEWHGALPRNANGKLDRPAIAKGSSVSFTEEPVPA